jgi:hypothetical protein
MSDNAVFRERLQSIYEPENGRFELWRAALKQWGLNPAFGTGSGSYLVYGRLYRSPSVQGDPVHVHSDYLEMLAEYGLIGFILALAFISVHITSGLGVFFEILKRKVVPGLHPASNELALLVGAIAAAASILFHSLVDFNFHLPANALVGAWLFGIMARPTSGGVHGVAIGIWSENLIARGVAPILGVCMLGIAGRLFCGEYFNEKARIALRDWHLVAAEQLALRGSEFDKGNPDLYYIAGQAAHLRAKDVAGPQERLALNAEAVGYYEQAIKIFPNDTRLLVRYGQVLDLVMRSQDADAAFERARVWDPNLGSTYSYLGMHYQLKGKIFDAERCYFKALELGGLTEGAGERLKNLQEARKNPLFQVLVPR